MLDAFCCKDADRAALHDRAFVLADLVALRQVGIEVVLAREDRARVDLCADGEAEADRVLDRALVHHRKDAGQCDVDRRGLRIGLRAEGSGCGGKDLAPCEELRVRLDADDDFPGHAYLDSPRSSWQFPRRSMKSGSR